MNNFELFNKEINLQCRTCLKLLNQDDNPESSTIKCNYNLFLTPNLAEWLSICTSLMINENDGYPKYLCSNCYVKICNFYEFRAMCLKSNELFKERNKLNNLKLNETSDNIDINNENKNNYIKINQLGEDCSVNIKEIIVNNYKFSDLSLSNEQNSSYFDNNDNTNDKGSEKLNEIINKVSIDKTIDESKIKLKQKTGKVHQCQICNKRFFKNDKYQAHIRTHKGLKPWDCKICNKSYLKHSSLKHHIKFVHENDNNTTIFEQFKCDAEGCNKIYKLKSSLHIHYRKVHLKITKQKECKKFICEECGKSMSTLGALKRHHLIHSGELPFKCNQCSKCYRTKYKLDEHVKRHQGIKNFICSICGLKKISRHELNVHMNYHTKKKQFNCKYCSYASANIGNVIRHEKVVHQRIKSFECKYCGNSFGKAETLKHHVMIHTGEKPQECDICGKRFIQRTTLKTHLKSHENGKLKSKTITKTDLITHHKEDVNETKIL